MRISLLFALLLVSLGRMTAARAQQQDASEGELLPRAVTSRYDTGIYHTLNRLPEKMRRSCIFARELDQLERKAGPSGIVDANARYDAFVKSQQDLYDASLEAAKSGGKNSILSNAWTNIGPNTVSSPSSYTIGGCTEAIEIDPTNTDIMYAGAAGGGVWKSTDAGADWYPLTDLAIPDLAVSTIAIDPNNHLNVYVGTGDGFWWNTPITGTGLYKTTDGGNSWARIGASTFTGGVVKTFVDPTNSSIVFASGYDQDKGVWRSTNGGSTWSQVYTATGVVFDICYGGVGANGNIYYLLDGNDFATPSNGCGVYQSIDNGVTWAKLTNGMPPGDSIERGMIACPSGATNKVYVLMVQTGDDQGNLLGLYESTNSGNAFSKVSGLPTSIFSYGAGYSAQGEYDLYLGMSPNAETNDTIFVGGIQGWYNDGNGWTQYSGWDEPIPGGNPHVDQHAFAMNPNNPRLIYIGTDGGIWNSTDAGQDWATRNNGYSTMRIYHVGLDKNDARVTWAGAQDAGLWKTVDGVPVVDPTFKADGMATVVDFSNSTIYYNEIQGYELTNKTGNIISSTMDASDPGYWDNPFQMGPHNHLALFTARSEVWESTNSGTAWNPISSALDGTNQATGLGLSPASASVIFVGYPGAVYLTTNGGTSWAAKNNGIPSAPVNGFACHPYNANWALVALGSLSSLTARVMLTTNQGTSWTNVSGSGKTGLPGVPVNAIAIDSVHPYSTWYAATDNGIYYTIDSGKVWSIAGSGIGLAPCHDVKVHPNGSTIRVATFGRGVYEATANALPVELDALTATPTPNGTQLKWHTDAETNNLQFNIMRSIDNDVFENIGTVASSAPGGSSSTPIYYSFFDSRHDTGDYLFQLQQVDLDGAVHYSNEVQVHYGPNAFQLSQNYPNPFVLGDNTSASMTRIDFALPATSQITLKIYADNGALIRTLVDHQELTAGAQSVFWNGNDASGKRVASGVYYYNLETSSNGHLSNKMIVVN